MRALTTMTLALGVTLTAAAMAPAGAAGTEGDGTRLNGDSLKRFQLGRLAPRATAAAGSAGAATAGTEASREPASAAVPCPGGGGGVWLNGTSPNGLVFNGFTLQGQTLQGTSLPGPGPVLQGRSPAGEAAAAAGTGRPRVTAVRLPDGRALAIRQR